MQTGVIKMHPLIWLEVLPQNLLVMSHLHSSLVNLGVIICIISQLLNFRQLELAMYTCSTEIKVKGFDSPISLMFELYR